MMLFLIILLSVVMVIDCILLVFLVLMQLPKKEAGVGVAFGGAATDALFGAGSGNFLTKATKYAAGIFFALALILSILQTHRANQPGSAFLEQVSKHANEQPIIAPPTTPVTPPPAASGPPPVVPLTTNFMLTPSNGAPATTIPTNAASSAPAQK